jgi:hypothetical protein
VGGTVLENHAASNFKSPILKKEAVCSSEVSISTYKSVRCHDLEDYSLRNYRPENISICSADLSEGEWNEKMKEKKGRRGRRKEGGCADLIVFISCNYTELLISVSVICIP